MYQFFVEASQIRETEILIKGTDVNHMKNVLRMKTGEKIKVSNGQDGKEYHCVIAELLEDSVLCKIESIEEENTELSAKVYLFQGLPKADKMELIIQKAVELGAYKVIPVAAKRAVVKLDAKKEKSKITRWQGIAEAAAKQSKRAIIPEITQVHSWREAVEYAATMDVKLIPYELSEGMDKTKEYIKNLKKNQKIAVFIGPEGGFAPEEIESAKTAGIEPITLGKRILRTETAGMTVLSWIMFQLEES